MKNLRIVALGLLLTGAVGVGLTRAQDTKPKGIASGVPGIKFVSIRPDRAQDTKPETKPEKQAEKLAPPKVGGAWTGDWGMYSPPPKSGEVPVAMKKFMYPEQCKQMDAKVEEMPDGKWQATFEGECGRPYKYTIKMEGRQAGNVVMFQGSADLGEKDGGVFDWIGRANDKEFIGFFTSKGYTGVFRMARAK